MIIYFQQAESSFTRTMASICIPQLFNFKYIMYLHICDIHFLEHSSYFIICEYRKEQVRL